MRTSDATNEIAAAMAKAQGAMRHASFDAVNPAFRSKYATLSAVIDAVRASLSVNSIAWVQSIAQAEVGVYAITRLLHSSGQWLELDGPVVPVDKNNAHGVGSATTYAKRFGLAAAVGIAADDDDDGNSAAHNNKPAPVQSDLMQEALARIAAANDSAQLGEIGADLARIDVDETSKKKLRAAFTARRKALEAA